MGAARVYILAILSLASTLQARGGQEPPAVTPEQAAAAATAAAVAEKQIRIYRATLAEAKDEQTRLDAATLLLFSDIPEARKQVLQALRDDSSPLSRSAICRALIVAREDRRPVVNRAEFMEPLMAVLKTETDPAMAELVAQAMLMLTYDDVQKQLEGLVDEPNAPKAAVFNAIRALKYQPDERALLKLISLVNRPDTDVAGESKKTLSLIGIDVPRDPNGIRALIEGLHRKGPEVFITNPAILKHWLVSRENRVIELQLSVAAWEQRYLAALGKLYDAQADDKARSDYLAQQLASQEPSVKLWVLGKLEELQKGTGKGKLPDQLKTMLLGLISHSDKRVRLKTANLLASMWEVNSTGQLLDQFQIEEDPDVRLAIFAAIGNVCYYASQPTSPSRVPEEVKKKTLELAIGFLNQPDVERTRSGADVIRKLLEQDGLKAGEVNRYLKALADRYRQVGPGVNHGLRGELLGAMASLCTQRSVCRAEATKLYGPVFEQALSDLVDSVRQAAIDGLVNMDKVAALKRLRNDAVKDPSLAVRTKLAELAGDVGAREDLDWLLAKLGQAGEGDAAWQAMLKIFKRSSMEVLGDWMIRLDPAAGTGLLSYDQRLSFLTLVEQKVQGDKDAERLKVVREKLFALCATNNNAAKAADYMGLLLGSATSDLDRQTITARLTTICLGSPTPNVELAAALVEKHLAEKDLDSQSPLAKSIKLYMNEPPAGTDPNALLDKLRQIKVGDPGARGLWRDQLLQWEALAKTRKPRETGKGNN